MKQPAIRRALRRADTLAAVKSAPKRKRSGIVPDSCGKLGEPHDLEGGGWSAGVTRLIHLEEAPSQARCGLGRGSARGGSSAKHAHIFDWAAPDHVQGASPPLRGQAEMAPDVYYSGK